MNVLKAMPLPALIESREPHAHVPARAVLFEDLDYEPLRFDATVTNGAELPSWLQVDADDGHLTVDEGAQLPLPLQLKVDFLHAEGVVGSAKCSILPPSAPQTLWKDLTPPLANQFSDLQACPLDRGVRECLHEQFEEVYDFRQGWPRELTLGAWLEAMARILRMLRSATVANVAASAPARPGQRVAR